jgi:transcriptional regulator with XRE-family HTH domain
MIDMLAIMHSRIDNTMERARRIFEQSGLSFEELGQRMGYSGTTARKSAWQFLRKTTDPRLSMMVRFAEALNVSLVDLVK